jgi:hypothetical protein
MRKKDTWMAPFEAYLGGREQSLSSFRCPFLANEESIDVMLEMERLVATVSIARITP